jgi:hypothetical protein
VGQAQRTLPGVKGPAEQLSMFDAVRATEQMSLDQPRLARVLDDLVASGDVEARGRGTKKRYTAMVRGGGKR